ncbi:MAG: heme biosynthesis protein HemY [Geminicoccaceae bacterium]
MIRLILFFAVAAGLSVVGVWLANNPGSMVLEWQGYTVQTSAALLFLFVLIAAVVLAVLFEILRWILGAPGGFFRWRQGQRREKGYTHLAQGLVAAAAGDAREARGFAEKAQRLTDHPATMLLAAQTAQLEGNVDAALYKYRQMLKKPETEFLGLRGLLTQAVMDGDLEEALTHAQRAYRRRPNTPWVLSTLFDLQTRLARWPEALKTVDAMVRNKLIPQREATRRRAVLMFMSAMQAREKGKTQEAFNLAKKANGLQSGFVPNSVLLSDLAASQGQHRLAARTIVQTWRSNPHPSLAKAFAALVPNESPDDRLKRFKQLADANSKAVETPITMAEAAMAARQWSVAREHLEKALSIEPTARVYRLLAQVEQAEGKGAEKAQHWLSKAVDAEADHAWVCEITGQAQATWTPFGPAGDFDSLRWRSPGRLEVLSEETDVADALAAPSPSDSQQTNAADKPREPEAVVMAPNKGAKGQQQAAPRAAAGKPGAAQAAAAR